MPTLTSVSPASLVFLGGRVQTHLQAEHRKRHANVAHRCYGMAGRRTVERHCLSDRTALWCRGRVRNNKLSSFSHSKDDGPDWRASLGGTVALHERFRYPTNPCDHQKIQRRKEVRTARRALFLFAASRHCRTCSRGPFFETLRAFFPSLSRTRTLPLEKTT